MLTDAHQISLIQTTSQPVKISDLLSAFLSGRSPRTLKAYSQDLADFHCFSKVTTTEDAARGLLSQAHGRANLLPLEYQTSLTERGLQSATINRRLAAVWSLDIQNVRTEAYRDTKGPEKTIIALESPGEFRLKGDRQNPTLRSCVPTGNPLSRSCSSRLF